MSLIEQTAVVSDFELAIVTPLAFLAVDRQEDQFRPAYNFATDLSAIKKFMRFAACVKLWIDVMPAKGPSPNLQCLGTEDAKEIEVEAHKAAELIQEQDKAQLSFS
ncbi:hypothetical protein PTNB85_10553 [Pyrenophora teres f. teres]|nr:hypothetical protein HRS9139_10515 [Pyrenophora teres f. teres]KAE8822039.1 hypothetical protein PTNB85_10553 [Pyrenophora teres f. teres]KAE8852398.1 hypothetical protein PTNB29_10494 [Pyrenophora teres f. teres]